MTRIIDKSNIKHKTLEEVKKEIRNSKSEVILEERKCEHCGGILVKSYGCGIGVTYCVDCGDNEYDYWYWQVLVAGGLAGLYYGTDTLNEIPSEWIEQIARKDWIKELYDEFYGKFC